LISFTLRRIYDEPSVNSHLQLLVCEVDEELLEAIDGEGLEAEDVENADEAVCHGSTRAEHAKLKNKRPNT